MTEAIHHERINLLRDLSEENEHIWLFKGIYENERVCLFMNFNEC